VSIRFGCTDTDGTASGVASGTASGTGRDWGFSFGAGVDDAGRRKDIEGCKYLIGRSCSHPFLIVLLFLH
jgi:hypothetical protein